MAHHAPTRCPVCQHTMQLTHLRCEQCETELTGRFAPCRYCALEERHLRFIETFLACRGSIKDVERSLGVSYPTVKNMLEGALEALGLAGNRPNNREEIIACLSREEITVDEAIKRLRESK